MSDKQLEVGHNERNEVVINLPSGEVGHIVFSVEQARALAMSLLKRCDMIDPTHAGLPEIHIVGTPSIEADSIEHLVSAEEVERLRFYALEKHQRLIELRSGDRVPVDIHALRELLEAVDAAPHCIRELQATRGIGNNCIDLLVLQFNQFATTPDAPRKPLDVWSLKLHAAVRNRASGNVYEIISIENRTTPIAGRVLSLCNPVEWEEVEQS